MKLPPVRMPNRSRLPRQNLGPAIQQQRNKLGVFNAITELGSNLSQQKIEADTAEQNAAYGDFVTQVEQELAGVDRLTPQQLRDAGLGEEEGVVLTDAGGVDRDYLLRHEWYPQLVDKRMGEAEESFGNKIMHAPAREAWRNEQKARRNDYITRLTKQSAQQAEELEYRDTEAKVSSMLKNGQWQSAIDMADSSPSYALRPDRKQAIKDAAIWGRFEQGAKTTMVNGDSATIHNEAEALIDPERDLPGTLEQRTNLASQMRTRAEQKRREEVEYLTEANTASIVSGDLEAVQKAYELLKNEEYAEDQNGWEYGKGSGLYRREALTEQQRLRQAIGAIRTKKAAADVNYLASGRAEVKSVIDAAANNPLMDMHEFDRADAILSDIEQHWRERGHDQPAQTDANLKEEVRRARRENALTRELSLLPLAGQHQILTGLRNENQNARQAEAATTLAKIVENSERELASNSINYARSVGWQIDEMPPMSDMPAFLETLSSRVDTDASIRTHWGKSSGPLDEVTELPLLMNQLQDMDQQQRNEFLGLVVQTLGEDKSKVVFEQMFEGDDYMPAITGILMAESAPNVALQIQAGAEYAAQEDFVMRDRNDVRTEVNELLGDAYGRGPQRGARIQAIMDHIAYQMVTSGDYAVTDGGDFVDEAIQAVTGGIFDLHESKVEAPMRGVTKTQMRQFEDHFEDNPGDLPNIYGGNKQSIANQWGGRFRLEPSDRVGVYYIRDTRGKNPTNSAGGSLLMGADGEGNPTGVPAVVEFRLVNPPIHYTPTARPAG